MLHNDMFRFLISRIDFCTQIADSGFDFSPRPAHPPVEQRPLRFAFVPSLALVLLKPAPRPSLSAVRLSLEVLSSIPKLSWISLQAHFEEFEEVQKSGLAPRSLVRVL